MLLVVLATIPGMVWMFFKIWPHTPIGKRVLLSPQQSPDQSELDELRQLIGTVVNNRWPLIPTGQVQINHRRYNARSLDSRPIEANCRVKVMEVHERMLVVMQTVDSLTETADRQQSSLSVQAAVQPTPESLLELPAEKIGLESLDDLSLDHEDPPN